MIPTNRIIIDTDPGVDDVIAILLALSAKPEELQVLLFSVVLGNTSIEKYSQSMQPVKMLYLMIIHSCLRNLLSIFHQVEEESKWRVATGHFNPFSKSLMSTKPVIAIGAHQPLEEPLMLGDYYRQ